MVLRSVEHCAVCVVYVLLCVVVCCRCSVLSCVVVCCSVLSCVVLCCVVLSCVVLWWWRSGVVVVVVVVAAAAAVVEWLYYSKRIIIVRWADLSEFFFVDFRRKNVCFCFTSNENCHFSSEKTVRPQNGLLIFLWKETHSETKSWTSSRILTKKVTTTTANLGNRRGFCF